MSKKIFKNIIVAVFLILGITLFKSTNAFAGTDSWKMYNDTDPNITYEGDVRAISESGNYAGTYHGFYKGAVGSLAKFNFTGNKLRIYGLKCDTYTSQFRITIDGVDYTRSARTSSSYYHTVLFEVANLEEGEHDVVIKSIKPSPNPYTFDFRIDSVSVDSDDMLLPYSGNHGMEVVKFEAESVPRVNDEFYVDLYLDNVNNIKTESINIQYDKNLADFIKVEPVDGIRIVKCITNGSNIKVSFVSKTSNDYVNGKKLLGRLKFKAKASGNEIIKAVGGKIYSPVNNTYKTLTELECGRSVIAIR